MTTPRTVELADLLSAREAAQLSNVTETHLRVLLARGQFPTPIRTKPNLWLREQIADWLTTRG